MFQCEKCGKHYTKWQGQCTICGEWNSLSEIPDAVRTKGRSKGKHQSASVEVTQPVKLNELGKEGGAKSEAIQSGIYEFDNTVGGRILPGQVILFAGSPGIGKSTLTLQIIDKLSTQKKHVLYVCGEESPYQIKQRADRLQLELKNVLFLAETDIRKVENYIVTNQNKLDMIVVDSIQTMYEPTTLSSSGSVSQIAESTNILTNLAKGFGLATIVIGHVTKSGDIAGPMILEHMVDTVLYLEGERRFEFRILRVEKNRFGPTDEAGIFRMANGGLIEVKDTKDLFDAKKEEASGSVYALVLEGTRPVVVEVQALVTKTYFSNPRRTTSGFDLNRLYILLAILDKKLKMHTGDFDVYVNITGGIKVNDPAVDLAVLQAIISSLKDIKIDNTNVYFGEVGLTGEVRKVYLQEKRIKEGKRLGFSKIYSSEMLKNVIELKPAK